MRRVPGRLIACVSRRLTVLSRRARTCRRNSARALVKDQGANTLLFLFVGVLPLLAAALAGVVLLLRGQPAVAVAVQLVGLVPWCFVSLLAAQRRLMMAQEFNILEQRGARTTFLGSWARWAFCCWCTLAQEARTLEHNRVRDGIWRGPSSSDDLEAGHGPGDAHRDQGGMSRQQGGGQQQHAKQRAAAQGQRAQEPQTAQAQARDQYYKQQCEAVAEAITPCHSIAMPSPAPVTPERPLLADAPAGAGTSAEVLAVLAMASPFATARNMPKILPIRPPGALPGASKRTKPAPPRRR